MQPTHTIGRDHRIRFTQTLSVIAMIPFNINASHWGYIGSFNQSPANFPAPVHQISSFWWAKRSGYSYYCSSLPQGGQKSFNIGSEWIA
ncbi:hypothetical protein FZI46_18835 [Cronobacter sakazakii]|nr:hypothetical protein FZI46_18835 [Cronobacter sakazakii]HAU5450402.1 hypothetical protein [Cronobacter sakazakii]